MMRTQLMIDWTMRLMLSIISQHKILQIAILGHDCCGSDIFKRSVVCFLTKQSPEKRIFQVNFVQYIPHAQEKVACQGGFGCSKLFCVHIWLWVTPYHVLSHNNNAYWTVIPQIYSSLRTSHPHWRPNVLFCANCRPCQGSLISLFQLSFPLWVPETFADALAYPKNGRIAGKKGWWRWERGQLGQEHRYINNDYQWISIFMHQKQCWLFNLLEVYWVLRKTQCEVATSANWSPLQGPVYNFYQSA